MSAPSKVRYYEMRRPNAPATALTSRLLVCLRHLEARKAIGWIVLSDRKPISPDPACDDCTEASQPTILDRVIAEADKDKAAAEPKPPRVLKGQRRLF